MIDVALCNVPGYLESDQRAKDAYKALATDMIDIKRCKKALKTIQLPTRKILKLAGADQFLPKHKEN